MRSTPRYTLWFVNQSQRAGQVCIYHDLDNVACSQGQPQQLAWRVGAANPQVQLAIEWDAAWDLMWRDDGADLHARQFAGAAPAKGSAVLLSRNAYGCEFTALPEQASRGQLSVHSDASIPAGGAVQVGLALGGAAAFALPAGPNLSTTFTPARERDIGYWISFGAYGLDSGAVLDPGMLNLPLRLRFPERVTTMTAILDAGNGWTLHSGPPLYSQRSAGR